MDADTRQELEKIAKRVPRYLFRIWNDSFRGLGRPSGGFPGLNRPEAIKPLAFSSGRGHPSVYDLTKEEFIRIAIYHLTSVKEPWFQTEFSSWGASLAFVLHYFGTQLGAPSRCQERNIGVSIIDTKGLHQRNEIFYVPDLAFLDSSCKRWDHEYLVYGVVSGPALKCAPYKVFRDAGFLCDLAWTPKIHAPIVARSGDLIYHLNARSLKRARAVGDQYGERFALPMLLAFLCRVKRDEMLFQSGVSDDDLRTVLDGIKGRRIPEEWDVDRGDRNNVKFVAGYGDVEQFHRLMNILSERRVKEAEHQKPQVEIHEIQPKPTTRPTQVSGMWHECFTDEDI